MIELFVNGLQVQVDKETFPAGESKLTIRDNVVKPIDGATIILDFESNSDLIDLLLLTDALRRTYSNNLKICLNMSYVPYARQDRVCNYGEGLSIKVITDLINSQNYFQVSIADSHSEVTPALLNNCKSYPLVSCASSLPSYLNVDTTILVSPDAGANKKVFEFAKHLGYPEVVRADKTRDVATGKITGTKVYHEGPTTDKNFLILDDICDGGYTFIQLAKELKKYTTGDIYLYVTHGIFSKGLQPLIESGIKTIYVSNLMYRGSVERVNDSSFVRVI